MTDQLLNLGALNLLEGQLGQFGLDMTTVHRAVGDPGFMADRQVVDGLLSEVVEFHFYSGVLCSGSAKEKLHFKRGKIVMRVSVT